MSAERGWIADPPPERERTPPSHRYKWHRMMGATNLCPRKSVRPFGRPSNEGGLVSAERGWIADPPPQRQHHTPGWLSEKGTGRSHFHSDKYATEQRPSVRSAVRDEQRYAMSRSLSRRTNCVTLQGLSLLRPMAGG